MWMFGAEIPPHKGLKLRFSFGSVSWHGSSSRRPAVVSLLQVAMSCMLMNSGSLEIADSSH